MASAHRAEESAHDPSAGPAAPAADAPEAAVVPGSSAGEWRAALAVLGLCYAVLGVAFFATFQQMVVTWYESRTFNHGFAIFPICAWLIWERREALVRYSPRPELLGLIPLFAAVAFWVVGNAADVQAIKQFAVIGMIQATALTVLGWPVVRAMLFPLCFLLLAVPFGEFLIPTLQDITAVFVVEFLRLIDIPVYIDGVFISIPTGNFEVAEACSGIRFLTATVALGVLFANLCFRSFWRRAVIVALSVAVPVVANGIRAFGIVYIAHITDHKVAVGVDHLVYGWIFFALVTVILLAIGMTFRETDAGNDIYMPRSGETRGDRPKRTARLSGVVAAVLIVLCAGPAFSALMVARGIGPGDIALTLPERFGDWLALDEVSTDWRPHFQGADRELMKTYRKGGTDVHVYLAYYTHQRQGAEIVHGANTLVQPPEWQRANSGQWRTRLAGRELSVAVTRLRGYRTARLAWTWFWLNGEMTSDPVMAKIIEARGKLLGDNQAAAAIVVAADFHDVPADAAARLGDFLAGADAITESFAAASRR